MSSVSRRYSFAEAILHSIMLPLRYIRDKCKPDTDREVLGQYLERFGAIYLRKVDKLFRRIALDTGT